MKRYEMQGASSDLEQQQQKRHRPNAAPSKCLHVRALPLFCTEQELIQLFSLFGRVHKVLVMSSKQQAFVQMDSIGAATNAINHFAIAPAIIRQKTVYIQYSNHQELTQGGNNTALALDGKFQANSILMVSIENVQTSITLDNLVTVFKPFGSIMKIVTFIKGGQYKVLVQMRNVESATAAKANLEGKCLFQGQCLLRISFSKLSNLTVTNCGPKSWDFTARPNMDPQMQPAFGMHPHMAGGMYGGYGMTNPYDQKQADMLGGLGYDPMNPFGNLMGLGMGLGHGVQGGMNGVGLGGMQGGAERHSPVVLVSNLPTNEQITPKHLFNLFGCYGNVIRVKILFKKLSTALVQFMSPTGAALAQRNLHGAVVLGQALDVRGSRHAMVNLPKEPESDSKHLNADFSTCKLHRFKAHDVSNAKNIFPPGPVLHASNIAPEVTEAHLVEIFRPYGITGFEWLTNVAKKMAFVRLESTERAIKAVMNLHLTELGGRTIRVSFSKKDPASLRGLTAGESSETNGSYQNLEAPTKKSSGESKEKGTESAKSDPAALHKEEPSGVQTTGPAETAS
eukprot:CAMPEP_0114496504 /NCGR_PEP_ID=MMETSP0109-20121206/5807_1 /TAXON_ID=29199 /ORGANISM="Chlorarachnion reptans, Strain CCCM449" /LENGTH=565 /DNA_ID=CAMNT_0001673785 /DNA_START=84 /DNA_END=1781 /DNA_ORIENTATION=+